MAFNKRNNRSGGKPPGGKSGGGKPTGGRSTKKKQFSKNTQFRQKSRYPGPRNNQKPRARVPIDVGQKPKGELEALSGVFDLMPEGHGFLRRLKYSYAPTDGDVLVPADLVKEYALRKGVLVEGRGDPEGAGRFNGSQVLWEIEKVEGVSPEEARNYPAFSNLTSIDPQERLVLEGDGKDVTLRVLDFLTPVGRGQRGLIVSPPRAGKTIILQKIAKRVMECYPEVHLMVLLIDERPEEATHFKRAIDGEVIYSTSDEPAERHIKVTEIVIERARRLVESGKDTLILMDSLTRLGRAYNVSIKNSGRTLSGGVDSRTLEKPKAFFGSARKSEEGGSLTILATALIETGSRMDQVIFEEFKGTGNMELVLSRKLADRRVFPAIDINKSGTRKEELLVGEKDLERIWMLRRVLNQMESIDGMIVLLDRLSKTENNEEFLESFQSK